MASLAMLDNIVEEFPAQLQTPLRHFAQWTEEQLKIPRDDFLRLEHALERLADAQVRTEQRVEDLVAAQSRTDQRLDQLAGQVQELTKSQSRTEQRMEELVQAQARTEQRMETFATREDMEAGFKSLSEQIAALGSRWGIYNEGTFRATIQGILPKWKALRFRKATTETGK